MDFYILTLGQTEETVAVEPVGEQRKESGQPAVLGRRSRATEESFSGLRCSRQSTSHVRRLKPVDPLFLRQIDDRPIPFDEPITHLQLRQGSEGKSPLVKDR